MATYFHGGSEIQTDGLQTLYLMNPSYVGYTDAAAASASPANMVLLNSTMNSLNPISYAHAAAAAAATGQSSQQHFVGIPLQPTLLQSHESNNPWMSAPGNNPIDMVSQLGIRRPTAANTTQQGLSLSLSSDEMVNAVVGVSPMGGEEVRVVGSSSSAAAAAAAGVSNGLHSFLTRSKYLKAAQQLLDEVVSVGKGSELSKKSTNKNINGDLEGVGHGKSHEEVVMKRGCDLTTAEKQELQMKKAKLVNMLDEVEQRYRQYHHQMQIVVSTFEAVAGPKSARTYTDLALQTISKQFRCLRDAIAGQIRATSRSLGEEETKSVGSRLRLVDHHLRQQRALQQLGMMQHNAWRPQRGLPERSVSILRAWLFEHFLHPYPKDSDKVMLAKQTGLTRSQVSNWFINARVRLWKPMVEEMYLEETKDQEQHNTDENSTRNDSKTGQSEKLKAKQDSPNEQNNSSITMPRFDDESMMHQKLKKARSDEQNYANNAFDSRTTASNRELLMKFMEGRGGVGEQGYFGGYSIGEIGRFGSEQFTPAFSGNGVSLTLGLQHCENISLSGAQQSYLSNETMAMGRRLDQMSNEANGFYNLNNNSNNNNNNNNNNSSSNSNNNNSAVARPSNGYDVNMENRKRFAAQLLPDFVS